MHAELGPEPLSGGFQLSDRFLEWFRIKKHSTYLLSRAVSLILLANSVYISSTHITLDHGSIAVIAVDTSQDTSLHSGNSCNSDMALIHVIAISTGAIQLSKIVCGEPLNVHRTGTIVLDDFVLGTLGATSDDIERAGSGFQGQGVYEITSGQ